MEKKILVICNVFPPAPGIGGRRWAKFSKYLTRLGFEVHVAFPEPLTHETSSWNKDVNNNPAIISHPLHFEHRSLFLKPAGTLGKLKRKSRSLRLASTKFSERFLTSLPNDKTWQQVADLITSEKINTVFVSGDPFLHYYACRLKQRTNCRVILDYRDLWNDHSYYRNFYQLTPKQWRFFEEAENTALSECDAVITVDEHLQEILARRVAGVNKKTCMIHNGFDPEDFQTAQQPERNDNKMVLYFAGNLASDLNYIVEAFALRFDELRQHKPELYNRIEVYFKGKMDPSLKKKLEGLALNNLKTSNDFISLEQYNAEVMRADMGIVVLGKEYANAFTTKFSDYLFLDKKVLVLGCPGRFSQFVQKYKYGSFFDVEKSTWHFFEELVQAQPGPARFDEALKERFNVRNLTQQLVTVYEKYSA